MSENSYHAIVVGAGPSGLFSALELAQQGFRVALLEKGGYMRDSLCPKVGANVAGRSIKHADRFRSQCPRCNCLEGIGGAAFHFDTNLGYAHKLSRSKIELGADNSIVKYSGLERLVGNFEVAESLIREVNRRFTEFGIVHSSEAASPLESVNQTSFNHVDTETSTPVPLDRSLLAIENIEQDLQGKGVDIRVRCGVQQIRPGTQRRWLVRANDEHDQEITLEADHVIVGVGKSALPWVVQLLVDLGVEHQGAKTVDLGIRLETLYEDLRPITDGCRNPKLSFLSGRGETVRTFCVCDGGRLMQYEMAGVVILDGQHCINNPTRNSNFGVLTTARVPKGIDGTEYALSFARNVNNLGDKGPVVQTLADFQAGRTTTSLADHAVKTSLVHYSLGNLATSMPEFMVEDILEMVQRLNQFAPGCVQPYSLITAPVIERMYPRIEMSVSMETSQPGLFLVGDCSGKLIGITYGAATGLLAARAIVQDHKGKK